MKAWLLDELKGISGLRLDELSPPEARPGEAVLRVLYAALNPADRYLAEAQYPAKPPLPHILGRDGIGVVTEVGSGVSDLRPGDHRVILRSEIGVTRAGTFAEYVAVPVESLVPPPPGWTQPQAGAAPLVYLTAWQALTQWGEPAPRVVLVTGASGGVGVASVQLAAAQGSRVVALSRDPGKREQLRQLGSAITLDPNDPEWTKKLREQLAGQGVDLAIDNIGGTLLPQVISTLGDHGKVSLVGQLAGPTPQFNSATLFFRRLRLGGVAVGAYTPQESRAEWDRLLAVLNRAGAKPLVDCVLPFGELPEAFDRLKKGPMGKVLIEGPKAG